MHIGIYLNDNNPEDVALKKAVDRMAEKEHRSTSDMLRLIFWTVVEQYDAQRPFLKQENITVPVENPFRFLNAVPSSK